MPWTMVYVEEEEINDESVMEEDIPQCLEIPVGNTINPSYLTALAVPLQ